MTVLCVAIIIDTLNQYVQKHVQCGGGGGGERAVNCIAWRQNDLSLFSHHFLNKVYIYMHMSMHCTRSLYWYKCIMMS